MPVLAARNHVNLQSSSKGKVLTISLPLTDLIAEFPSLAIVKNGVVGPETTIKLNKTRPATITLAQGNTYQLKTYAAGITYTVA